MKTLKKLPVLLAFLVTLFAAACSDVSVEPVVGTDDDDEPIILGPFPDGFSSPAAADTVSI